MSTDGEQTLPIRVVVTDDLERSRATVFFRLLLAIPHLIVVLLFGIAAMAVTVIVWLALLVEGKAPSTLQDFVAAYVRYQAQVAAYLNLAANPYPSFGGDAGYPVDVEIEVARHQTRGRVAARLVLAVPALLLLVALGGGTGSIGSNVSLFGQGREDWWLSASSGLGLASTAAALAWFAALARGRMPLGLRDLIAYCIGYTAQATGYVLLVTDRYPTSDPGRVVPLAELPPHPVRVAVTDDLRRSRLTVFLRFPLALPHLIWLLLWSLVVVIAFPLAWLATLITGRLPGFLHRFFSAWIRYSTHVVAFLYVIGGPFPGFTGAAGSYPVDIEIDAREPQRRATTLFRLVLALPALILGGAYGSAALGVALLGWWASLFTGRMPEGLRNLGAASLRYSAQTTAYFSLVTGAYPFSSPALRDRPHDVQLELLLEPAGPVETEAVDR